MARSQIAAPLLTPARTQDSDSAQAAERQASPDGPATPQHQVMPRQRDATPTAMATRGRAVMIVPTYNEASNIEPLLDALFSLPAHQVTGWTLDVLVRDDSSPDGTGELAAQLAESTYSGRLRVSHGTKAGLGSAMKLAFDEALALNYDVILTMDADFSHSPTDVLALLDAINAGADVAVGSRYTDGGLIPGNWPIGYIVRTRVACAVARFLGGVDPSLKELTTNFRAIRRRVLQNIDYSSVDARGYGFMIYLANAFVSGSWVVKEVPISFHTRAEGVSKARLFDIAEFFRIAYRLNDDSPFKQLARFVIVGVCGTLVNLGVLWLLRQFFPDGAVVILLSAIAIQVSILWNFTFHSLFTFKRYRREHRGRTALRAVASNLGKYQVTTALTQTIIFTCFVVLSNLGVFYLLAQLLGIGAAFVINYYVSSTYIWAESKRRAVAV